MRIAFRVTEAGFDDDGYALICGVSDGADNYLIFSQITEQVAAEQPDENWGVHFEFKDQSNGDYHCIRSCRLNRSMLNVDLSKQLGKLRGVEGFDVELNIDDEEFAVLATGLRRVFRDQSEKLQIK